MKVGIFPARKKSKNRFYCAVKDCQSKANKDLNVIFRCFPKTGDRSLVIGNLEKFDKFKAWKNLLKINKVTTRMKVRSLH